MVEPAPKIDERTALHIEELVGKLLAEYVPDQFSDPHNPDKLRQLQGISAALVKIFSRFSEIIIQRLNQVPDKNFLAFLDLLGASRLPPQPARVPLTFSLAAGSAVDAVVPAGTQVAAPPAEGQSEPIIFETEQELVVTAAELTSIFTRDPQQDKYGDKSAITQPTSSEDVPVFQGDSAIAHILYIGHDTFLGYPDLQTLTLTFNLKQAIQNPDPHSLQWEIWDGDKGIPILPPSESSPDSTKPRITSDTTSNLTKNGDEGGASGTVVFANLSQVPQQTIFGITSRWLRCRLLIPITQFAQLPFIKIASVQARFRRSQLLAKQAFTNLLPIDLSKDFFPFGEKPKLGDTFYLADTNAFSKSGSATITLHITLTDPASGVAQPVASNNLRLQWEFWDGKGWAVIGTSIFQPPTQTNPLIQFTSQPAGSNNFNDGTRAFTTSNTVTFTFPAQPALTTVNGIEDFWIRVRILAGNYGVEASYQQSRNAQGQVLRDATTQAVLYEFSPATFTPPSINALTIDYDWTTPTDSPTVLTYNDFKYKQVTPVSGATSEFFQPFQPTQDFRPTFYLGFSLPLSRNVFPNRPLNVYFKLADVIYHPNIKVNPSLSSSPPRLVWQYWSTNSQNWEKLIVQDETEAFTHSGLVGFLLPEDFAAKTDFGSDRKLYWLRVFWESGDYPVEPPKQRRVLLNTTMAAQTVTIRNETLGSSDGSESQVFRTTQIPVLPGQQLQVQEPELPAANEQKTIKQEEGDDAIATTLDATAGSQEIWVRWHEVADFYGSGPRDRHYVLDHLTGEIRFGDGLSGLIPPVGTGNLRLVFYQTGGGAKGNSPIGTIVQLRTTVPYVEKVTNIEAAAGGADAESLESLRDRIPKTVRHRNQAVTFEDYEDLAMLASPEVVRAQCVPIRNLMVDPLDEKAIQPGEVSVIIVPRTTATKPLPSQELLDRVRNYLQAHSLPTVNITVVGPLYVQVRITVEIAVTSLERASNLEQAVEQRLIDFLHPLTGGFEGTGWTFGREPYKSDFYKLIEKIPGVDHIRTLRVDEEEELPGIKKTNRFLVYSGRHTISLVFEES